MKKGSMKSQNINYLRIIPLILIVAVVPLIVRLKVIKLTDLEIFAWTGQDINYDFFSYYKMITLLFLAILSLVIYLKELYSLNIEYKNNKIHIPMFIYIIFVILSVIFSGYKKTALFGFPDRYEGALVIIAYVLLAFLTVNLISSLKHIKYIIYSLLISSGIISLIGFLQYFNINLIKSNFFRLFIMPASLRNAEIKFDFDGTNAIYSTLYHYNYVGSYMVLVFPIAFTLFLFSKNMKNKILFGVLSFLTLFNLIGSSSRAGFVGLVISALISLIFFRNLIKRNSRKILIFSLIILVLFFGFNFATGNNFGRRITTLLEGTDTANAMPFTLKNIYIDKNIAAIETSDKILKLNISNQGDLIFKDEKDKILNISFNNGQVTFKDKGYSDYSAKVFLNPKLKVPQINIIRDNFNADFVVKDGQISFYDPKGKGQIIELKEVQKFGFNNMERIGSARGYIWSRSIPLLKNTIFVGYGPDTFAFDFPQYDYVGKFNAYGTTNIAVDKPHNLYLNIALSTGILSLIAFLFILIFYYKDSFKNFINMTFKDEHEIYGIAILIGITGYLTAALFNDSVVSVAPVFWVLLGIGININLKLMEQNEIEKFK